MKEFYTYILTCSDGTLYTGWTTRLDQRLVAHNRLKSGAKYTRTRRPVVLSGYRVCSTRSEAQKLECTWKKMTRAQKLALIDQLRSQT